MSEKVQRVGILLIVFIFVASTIGVVVYSIIDNKNKNKVTSADQAQIQQAKDEQNKPKENLPDMTCTNDPSIKYTAVPPMKDKPLPNFTPVEKVPALTCLIAVPGSGDATVKNSDTVTVNYTGALAKNGNVFESSLDSQPATFPLSGVIPGWTQGLTGMKQGETRRLLIPSELGYGSSGSGAAIPPNSDLVFDVTLIKIGQ